MHPIHNWGLTINQFMLLFPFTQNSGQRSREVVQQFVLQPLSPRPAPSSFNSAPVTLSHTQTLRTALRTPQVALGFSLFPAPSSLYPSSCRRNPHPTLLCSPPTPRVTSRHTYIVAPPRSAPPVLRGFLPPLPLAFPFIHTTHDHPRPPTTTHRSPRTPRVASSFALASHAQQSLPLSYTCTNLFNGWL